MRDYNAQEGEQYYFQNLVSQSLISGRKRNASFIREISLKAQAIDVMAQCYSHQGIT